MTGHYVYPEGGGLELSPAGRAVAEDRTRCVMHNLDIQRTAEWMLTVTPSGNHIRVCSECFTYWVNNSLESVLDAHHLSS